MVRAAPRWRDPPGSRELALYKASAVSCSAMSVCTVADRPREGPVILQVRRLRCRNVPRCGRAGYGARPPSPSLSPPRLVSRPPPSPPPPPQALRVAVPTSRAVGRQPRARDCSRHAGWTSVRPGQRDPEGIRPRDPQILHFGIWMILSRRPLRIDRGGKKPARSLSAGRRREVREMRLPSAPSPGALQGHGQDGKSASRANLTQQPWSPFSCP